MKKVFLYSSLVFSFDQISKFIVLKTIALGASKQIIPNIVSFTHIRNTGVAFGLGRGLNLFFLVFSSLLILGLIISCNKLILYCKKINPKLPCALLLGLFIGGGLGNIFDRIFRGNVVDFIDFSCLAGV
ncbi:MAG: signal peptidase II [Elusimicrobiota bacterium]